MANRSPLIARTQVDRVPGHHWSFKCVKSIHRQQRRNIVDQCDWYVTDQRPFDSHLINLSLYLAQLFFFYKSGLLVGLVHVFGVSVNPWFNLNLVFHLVHVLHLVLHLVFHLVLQSFVHLVFHMVFHLVLHLSLNSVKIQHIWSKFGLTCGLCHGLTFDLTFNLILNNFCRTFGLLFGLSFGLSLDLSFAQLALSTGEFHLVFVAYVKLIFHTRNVTWGPLTAGSSSSETIMDWTWGSFTLHRSACPLPPSYAKNQILSPDEGVSVRELLVHRTWLVEYFALTVLTILSVHGNQLNTYTSATLEVSSLRLAIPFSMRARVLASVHKFLCIPGYCSLHIY